jgi:uncharacterized OB-fold protein
MSDAKIQSGDALLRRVTPSPEMSVETKPFWDAANEGRFLVKYCNACGQPHWYPRALCPFCMSDDTRWVESKGEGEVYSYSIMRRSPAGAYAVVYVKLDEGPTILSNIVDIRLEDLKIGCRVKVRFQNSPDGAAVPVFTPAQP